MVSVRLFAVSIAAVCSVSAQESSPLVKHAFAVPHNAVPHNDVSHNDVPHTDAPSVPLKQDQPAAIRLSWEEQGDLFMARKMFREAIDAYRKGPETSPIVWNKIGIACHQLGDLNAAKKNYEKSARIDKTYADAVNNDGTVYYAQKKYRTAIARYQKAIAIKPDSASFWSNLGTAYYSRGRFVEMTNAYQKALDLDPQVFEHHGIVGSELQDRTVADRARYHYEMARIYAKSGKDELALQYLRRSLEEGLKDKLKMTQAPEFARLRDTAEFQAIVALEPRVL